MGIGLTRFGRLRRDAAPMLIGVFVLAGHVAPVVHLATHRPDHTHGPTLEALDAAGHRAAHRASLPHRHDVDRREFDSHPQARRSGPQSGRLSSGDCPASGLAPEPPTLPGAPTRDHGRESVAHFGVALLEGPPPPIVPPPAEAIAPSPDGRPPRHGRPLTHQPPVRGPPAHASLRSLAE